jgi:nitrogen fixation protein FixH
MAMKRGWYWPWLLVAGMSGVVGVNVWMFVVAGSDANGSVVEKDYYRKAVEWDSTMALDAASARLGWQTTISLASTSTAASPSLSITLHDASGVGVSGATVHATLIHNADAGRPTEVALEELGGGRYGASPTLVHAGMWEVRVRAARGAARFVNSTRAERTDSE